MQLSLQTVVVIKNECLSTEMRGIVPAGGLAVK